MIESAFSSAQLVGYAAFVLGILSFLQRDDKRFKILLSFQGFVYAIHFHMLLNDAACASNLVSVVRNLVTLRTKSKVVAALLLALVFVLALFTVKSPAGFLPVGAAVVAIYAMFSLDGIKMRLALLLCTVFWLANNILSHSIGGIMLETVIGMTNIFTMVRMYLAAPKAVAVE